MTNFECEKCGKLYMNLKTPREIELEKKLKIAKTQMTLARDIAYDSSQSEPVRVQIDEILTEALKQMEEVK